MKQFLTLLFVIVSLSLSAQDGVGIGTTTPRSTLDINGNLSLKVVDLNGGPGGSATAIDDGTYINLTPTPGNVEFILPDATLYPGRIYILRNVSDSENATIYTFGGNATPGAGVEFFSGDSRASAGPFGSVTMTPDVAADGGDPAKTLIFISDGFNWTYGRLGL